MKITRMWRGSLWQKLSRRTLLIMRFSVVLLFGMLLQVSATSLAQRVVIEKSQMTYKELFREIERQTGLITIYNNQQVDKREVVNILDAEQDVSELYQGLLEEKGLTFEVVDDYIVIKKAAPKPVIVENVVQQEKIKIAGVVTDESGHAIPGVNVFIKGTQTGTITDGNGEYSLQITDPNAVLVVSFIGMETQELLIGSKRLLNVTLRSAVSEVDEVVVVGYGTTKRRDLTGSVASIKADDLMTESNVASFDQLLSGKLSGVVTTSTSGRPGAKAIVNIRGYSSLTGDNQPLYVIDGVPVLAEENVSSDFGRINNNVNPLSAINPSDIESVDVLKDASAAAIYGSRAANGVIIVTTKRGKKNQDIRVDVSYSISTQQPVKTHDLMNAAEYKSYMEKVANQTLALGDDSYANKTFAQNILDNKRVDYWGREHGAYFGDADEDYEALLTKSNPLASTLNVTVTGGSERGSFSMGANMTDQDGLFVGNGLKRYGLRTSLDFDATDWLSVGGSLNYNYSITSASGINDYRELIFNPTIGADETPIGLYGRPFATPIYNKDIESQTKANNILGNVYARFKLVKGLEFKSEVGFSVNGNASTFWQPKLGGSDARKTYSNYNTGNTTFTNTLNYNATLAEKHNVTAVAGASQDIRYSTNIGIGFTGFPNDKLNAMPGNNLSNQSTYEGKQQSILNSWFSRVNYNYDRRYYLTLTGRFDGSDRFTPEDRFGFFPAASASWKISNEAFLEDVAFIDDITIKGGYGETGNNNLQPFVFEALYSITPVGFSPGTAYNGVYGLTSTSFPNAQIKWETTKQTDIALEWSLFNSRLTGSVAYYKKVSEDIIAFNKIPLQTGFSTQNDNTTTIENKGWEIELGGDVIRTSDFRWNSAFNIAFNKNKLVSLNGSQVFETYNARAFQEGEPLGNIFGYQVEGIFQTQEEVDAANNLTPDGTFYSSNARIGNYKYKDVSGPDGKPDGKITQDDVTLLGNTAPDFYGGFNNSLNYKGISLDFNFSFVSGIDREYGFQTFIEENYDKFDGNNVRGILNQTWSDANRGAERAYAVFGNADKESSDYRYSTSREIHDASYIRLKALTLGYELPRTILDKVSLRSVKLSVSATNLLTWTNWPGLDPEAIGGLEGGGGLVTTTRTLGVYPTIQTFTFGVNIGL